MILEAREGSSQVLYASNESIAGEIVSLAKQYIEDEELITCDSDHNAKFDVYRNCFRDLSILLLNRLIEEFGSVWEVTTGSVDHCFSINTIDDGHREEYFLTVGNIYFQIFRFYAKEKKIVWHWWICKDL